LTHPGTSSTLEGVLPSQEPSDAARELVRGAYDLHVHIAPDVMRRRITDLELARRFLDVGLAGFALKSHYVPTAERAAVVNAAVPGIDAIGAITLNASVGGMNPLAVEIAARSGARIVWLPTVDAANHRAAHGTMPPDAAPPLWLALQEELAAKGMQPPEVAVVDAHGRPLPQTRDVLRLIAEHDMVLATGHLGREEIFAVTVLAFEVGVRHVVVTHPDFPYQRLSAGEQLHLAKLGALLERTFTTPYTGKCDWSEMVENIRYTGLTRSLVTTDLGQPDNPPVEDGLALMADALLHAGFDADEVRQAIVTNSQRLAIR
jgi:hypothetical protein